MEFDFDFIVDCLVNNKNISYARFGDGELRSLLGGKGANCDGHEYFPDMGKELKKILESKPSYYLGLQRLGKEQNEDNPEFKRLESINNWVNNEVFTRASINMQSEFLEKLRQALSNRRVIQVANTTIQKLDLFDIFIEIPISNCWLYKDKVMEKLIKHIEPNDVVLYSSSMPTKYFINEMYNEFSDTITQLDCGSVFDVYVGRQTRTYMKKIEL